MSKKVICILLILCMTVTVLAACGTSETTTPTTTPADTAPTEKAVVFKFSFGQPLEGTDGRGYQYLAQCIEEESGGTIKLELYPSSSLLSNSEVLDALMDGTADIAHVTVAYMSPTIKELTPLEIPGMYSGTRYMDFAYDLRDPVDEICNGYGLKILACLAACNMNFASTKEIIAAPEDMNGVNIRVAGVWMGKAISVWGGNPVTITLADVPTALERKTVDAVYGGTNTVMYPFKLYEMADNVSFTTLQENLGFIGMNLDSWNALSSDQQAAMKRAINSWAVYIEQLQLDDVSSYREALAKNGNNVYDLTDEENAVLINQSLTLLDEAIETAGPKGQELADICEAIRAKYDQPYTPGIIPDGYTE